MLVAVRMQIFGLLSPKLQGPQGEAPGGCGKGPQQTLPYFNGSCLSQPWSGFPWAQVGRWGWGAMLPLTIFHNLGVRLSASWLPVDKPPSELI